MGYFNSNCCRNIAIDIRYVLFIIDKFADAGYLLEEMNIMEEGSLKDGIAFRDAILFYKAAKDLIMAIGWNRSKRCYPYFM